MLKIPYVLKDSKKKRETVLGIVAGVLLLYLGFDRERLQIVIFGAAMTAIGLTSLLAFRKRFIEISGDKIFIPGPLNKMIVINQAEIKEIRESVVLNRTYLTIIEKRPFQIHPHFFSNHDYQLFKSQLRKEIKIIPRQVVGQNLSKAVKYFVISELIMTTCAVGVVLYTKNTGNWKLITSIVVMLGFVNFQFFRMIAKIKKEVQQDLQSSRI